tara:strand:+ start:840 stop:1181 length:342 start_codon:yes stop_codon:yes gene_type:complete
MAFNNKVATASQLWFLSFKVSEVLATEKKIKDEKAINKFTNTYKRWIYGILMHDLKRYEEGKIKKFLSGSDADDLINGRKKLADKYLKTLDAFISQKDSENGHESIKDFLQIG